MLTASWVGRGTLPGHVSTVSGAVSGDSRTVKEREGPQCALEQGQGWHVTEPLCNLVLSQDSTWDLVALAEEGSACDFLIVGSQRPYWLRQKGLFSPSPQLINRQSHHHTA